MFKKKETSPVISGEVDIKEVYLVTEEFIPEYGTTHSAGFDLRAYLPSYKEKPLRFAPGEIITVPTGLKMSIPWGYEVQIRPRSGLSSKSGIVAILGTVDADYAGAIGMILQNQSKNVFYIKHGDRLAQGVLAPVTRAEFKIVAELAHTERGEGGFGSTGIA